MSAQPATVSTGTPLPSAHPRDLRGARSAPLSPLRPHRRGAKRALDLALASVLFLVLAPAMGVIALAIVLHDGGPFLFRQTRVGMNGTTFAMYKFRSMTVGAESQRAELLTRNEADGPLFKIRNDPRVTRIGGWLRRHSLDELPQLINVIRGDMSLVGPRPALPEEMADWDAEAYRRLDVKPGVTGAWQVCGRTDLTWQEGIRLDVEYAGSWSIRGDLVLLARTVRVVALAVGAY